MSYSNLFIILNVALLGLCVLLFTALLRVRHQIKDLKLELAREKKKRLFPFLNIIYIKDIPALMVENESHCVAKDIEFGMTQFTIDYGFKKRLNLKYDSIPMLKPNERLQMTYRLYDKDDLVPEDTSKALATQIATSSYPIKIFLKNLENVEFQMTYRKDKAEISLIEANPVVDENAETQA